ncbi:SH3 domain-binding glutamic acid-rich protein homolog isoform X2 [Pollicipes pollicipes]|uniref:SH3 domain-binding glutamic acid-rich protein homolog isoform X2 n=1 Tax=Pollicipes pollicipes TaxID=41117 RepID=UPI001885A0AA|nr:SH3 domain-binding glutamic acid-rich protein homolog isoform X2 [Pollicipes pollicipes]
MTIKIYISGLSGNYEVKKRQQRIQTVLDSCAIQYELIDITEAGCEDERKFMQETATAKEGERNPLPPQIFNDKDYCGDYDGFDVANETDQLHQFLKLSEGEVNTAQDILSANRRSSSREQTPMAENGIDHADNPEPPAAAEATEEDHVEPPDQAPVDDLEVKTDVEPEAAEQREENDSAVDAEDEGAKDSKVDDSNEGATDEKVATPEPEAPEEETVPAADAKADVEDDKEDKSGDEESEGEDDEDENPDLADLKAAAQRLVGNGDNQQENADKEE